jgi:hypothetical protein
MATTERLTESELAARSMAKRAHEAREHPCAAELLYALDEINALRADAARLKRRATAYRELAKAFAEHSGNEDACRLALEAADEATKEPA